MTHSEEEFLTAVKAKEIQRNRCGVREILVEVLGQVKAYAENGKSSVVIKDLISFFVAYDIQDQLVGLGYRCEVDVDHKTGAYVLYISW